MGLFPDTYTCGLFMCRECRERFPRLRGLSDPDMHHGTCVTHVPWCMPGSLTNGFLWSRWRGNHSRQSRSMRNPQFYVSGKRPIALAIDLLQPYTKPSISAFIRTMSASQLMRNLLTNYDKSEPPPGGKLLWKHNCNYTVHNHSWTAIAVLITLPLGKIYLGHCHKIIAC